MSSSTKIDNKKKRYFVFGKDPTQGLEHTLNAEKLIRLILQKKNKKNRLSAPYNKENSYLFVNGTDIMKFKSEDPAILPHSFCLGNISKDWPVDNMKETRLNGNVYGFIVDYDAISVDDI